MPIKILHLISALTVGGAETTLARLLATMDRQRFDQNLVSMTSIGPAGERIKDLGIPMYALGNAHRPLPEPRSVVEFLRTMRHEQPDIVQLWMYHANLFGTVFSPFYRRARIVWNVRNSFTFNETAGTVLTAGMSALFSRLPARIIFNSQAGLESHKKLGYALQHAQVIVNGFDLQRFRPDGDARTRIRQQWGIDQHTVIIGAVGRLHPMKDYPTFLRAAALLLAQHKNVRFVCVGRIIAPEYQVYLQQLSQTLGVAQNFLWVDESKEMSPLYNAFDIFCSSSAYGEGFSNVICEAMACGVPCVVTDVGDARRIVDTIGTVVPPRDPETLAQGWQELLNLTPNERRSLGEKARERIRTNYSLETCVRDYESLYESLA